MIDPGVIEEFLAQRRLAVVGVSDQPSNFGRTIHRALREHGYDVVAVNPHVGEVDGGPCYPGLAAVPGELDGVIVMVPHGEAVDVVRTCVVLGVPRVWLFQGLGGHGAVSDEAIELCRQHGVTVVDGACPMMFLEPVGLPHRVHRAFRRLSGSLAPSAPRSSSR